MKKKLLTFLCSAMLVAALLVGVSGCSMSEEERTADCYNGQFVGEQEKDTGVLSFKGIPYAKQPTGERRWKAPEAVAKSDSTKKADKFGHSSIQYEWHSEPASSHSIGEDCLTLNVWTKDLEGSDKPIMFYVHGGGFAWGGTADPLYNGQYIVDEHSDVIVISANYRVGMMGLADLSKVPDGSKYKASDFKDSTNLQLLDLQQALRWVKQNAKAFGGDADNITIFGESAGGALVSQLMASPSSKGLFQRVIAESGSLNLSYDQADYDDWAVTEQFMQASGAKNMDDLMAMAEKDLIKYYTTYIKQDNGEETCVNDSYNMPLRGGSVLPKDPYKVLADGAGSDVDFMVGTNADEWRYWINEMGEKEMSEMSEKEIKQDVLAYKVNITDTKYQEAVDALYQNGYASSRKAAKDEIDKYLDTVKVGKADYFDYLKGDTEEQMWKRTELANEDGFAQPSVQTAQAHIQGVKKTGGKGKTYMYYFGKRSDNFPFIGACHATELAYVFHNIDETIFSGTVSKKLAGQMCEAWVNFAKTGDPSTDDNTWDPYTLKSHDTMYITNKNKMKMKTTRNSARLKTNETLKNLAACYLK